MVSINLFFRCIIFLGFVVEKKRMFYTESIHISSNYHFLSTKKKRCQLIFWEERLFIYFGGLKRIFGFVLNGDLYLVGLFGF